MLFMLLRVAFGSVTQMNLYPLIAHTKLSASPRFPDDDSIIMVLFGSAIPRRSRVLNKPYCGLYLDRASYIEPFQL